MRDLLRILRRLSPWQTTLFLGMWISGLFAIIYALINVPGERLEMVSSILLALLTGSAGTIGRSMLRSPDEQAEHEEQKARKRAARDLDQEIREVLKSSAPPPGPLSTLTSADATPASTPAARDRRDRAPGDRPTTGSHKQTRRPEGEP
jgi:hypothetical protein